MAEFVSVAEAAKLLDVSERRVRQLIEDGDLAAAMKASSWLVDRASVERRAGWGSPRGRPLGAEKAWQVAIIADRCVESFLEGGRPEEPVKRSGGQVPHLDIRVEQALGDFLFAARAGAPLAEPDVDRIDNALRQAREELGRLRSDSLSASLIDEFAGLEGQDRARYSAKPVLEAWEGLLKGAGSGLEGEAFRRLRNLSAHGQPVKLADLAPFRRRSDPARHFFGHPAVLPRVAGDELLAASGAHGAQRWGMDIVPGDDLMAYVNKGFVETIVSRHGLHSVPAQESNVSLMPVAFLHQKAAAAPRLFVAADLLERGDPRGVKVAQDLLRLIFLALLDAEPGR